MSRKSFQRVTLSVELTLPPGAKAKDAPEYIRLGLKADKNLPTKHAFIGLAIEQAVIKIIKRETIYTN